jgi:hypothetical protein
VLAHPCGSNRGATNDCGAMRSGAKKVAHQDTNPGPLLSQSAKSGIDYSLPGCFEEPTMPLLKCSLGRVPRLRNRARLCRLARLTVDGYACFSAFLTFYHANVCRVRSMFYFILSLTTIRDEYILWVDATYFLRVSDAYSIPHFALSIQSVRMFVPFCSQPCSTCTHLYLIKNR